MHRVFTVCPHCSCGCGLYLLVDRGEAIGVMPSAGHPVSRGSLCMKGWTSFQHLRHPERLDSPWIGRNGRRTRIPWDQAFACMVEGLEAVRLRHGGGAIGFWSSARATNEEFSLLQQIAWKGFESTAVRFDPLIHTLDHIPESLLEGPRAARLDDVQGADLLVVFGQGFLDHHPQVASRILKAIDQGARVVVISPYRDALAERATLHIQVPVSDDVPSAFTNGGDWLSERLRTWWGEAARPVVVYPLKSLPLQREAALLGAFESLMGESGAKVLLLFPCANSRGAFHRMARMASPGHRALKALVVVEENPAAWDARFRDLARDLDLLVVLDLFLTETAELAHLVLPSAGFAEKGGTFTNTEGLLQALQPAVPPPGEARPAGAILAELARRLGVRQVDSTSKPSPPPIPVAAEEGATATAELALASRAADDPPQFQHIPDRLRHMWLKDTLLRHTDDWQREHQDRWVEVHPEDANVLGLRPGWMVRIAGDGSEFQAMVRISERVGRGILVTPYDLFEGLVQVERSA